LSEARAAAVRSGRLRAL